MTFKSKQRAKWKRKIRIVKKNEDVLIRTFVEDVAVPYYLISELEIVFNIDQSLCPQFFYSAKGDEKNHRNR